MTNLILFSIFFAVLIVFVLVVVLDLIGLIGIYEKIFKRQVNR